MTLITELILLHFQYYDTENAQDECVTVYKHNNHWTLPGIETIDAHCTIGRHYCNNFSPFFRVI